MAAMAALSSGECPLDFETRAEVTLPDVPTVKLSMTVPSCPARLAELGYLGVGRLTAEGLLTIRLPAAARALAAATAFFLAVATF